MHNRQNEFATRYVHQIEELTIKTITMQTRRPCRPRL